MFVPLWGRFSWKGNIGSSATNAGLNNLIQLIWSLKNDCTIIKDLGLRMSVCGGQKEYKISNRFVIPKIKPHDYMCVMSGVCLTGGVGTYLIFSNHFYCNRGVTFQFTKSGLEISKLESFLTGVGFAFNELFYCIQCWHRNWAILHIME